MTNAPDIDNTSEASLLAQIQALVPQYTPEWRFTPEYPDAGSALFMTFARMFAGNLYRFNQVPYRNLLSYLHMLGVAPRPAHSATVYVCLGSSKAAGVTYVPQGTTFSASATDADGSPLTFEADYSIQVTRSQVQAMVVVNGAEDTIADVEVPAPFQGFAEALDVFGELTANNLQNHTFYVGSRTLFQCSGAVQIRLHFKNAQAQYLEAGMASRLASERVRWSYLAENQWVPFEAVRQHGTGLVLRKEQPGDMASVDYAGASLRWLRCEVVDQSIHELVEGFGGFHVDGVDVQVNRILSADHQGLLPDYQIGNDLEPEKAGYHPFGERFSVYNMWYIANAEALTKRGAEVEFSFYLEFRDIAHGREPQLNLRWRPIMRESQFKLPTPPRLHIHQVVWEYFNGVTWVRLDVDMEASELFRTGAGNRVRIRFTCPDDLAPSSVKSRFSHWIRIRVLSMDTGYGAYNIFVSPWIQDAQFHYDYGDRCVQPDRVIAENNLIRSELALSGQTSPAIALLETLGTDQKAIHFGWSDPLQNGPFSLYLSLQTGGGNADHRTVNWSYLTRESGRLMWKSLQVMDETDSLRQSGAIRFMISAAMERVLLFNRSLHWIRCEIAERNPHAPRIVLGGFYMNAVRASQLARVQQESPQPTLMGDATAYAVAHGSLLAEEVWVDETDSMTGSQLREVPEPSLRVVRDPGGNVLRVWVKWEPVQSFLMSSPVDRHYVVDRQRGLFYFGNGHQGRMPAASMTGVRIDYAYGGGKIGNVEPETIETLKNAIPFVNKVFNPDGAYGGQDVESVAEAVRRGSQLPGHQNRALTASDFEWLALEASTLVKEAKCISNLSPELAAQPGSVLLVILPVETGQPTFVAARQAVERHLRDRAVNLALPGQNLYVVEPAYVRVTAHVYLVVGNMEAVVPAQMAAIARLTNFLDTYSGGLRANGWHIGEFVHPSALYGLLKALPHVELVDRVMLTVERLGPDGPRELSLETAARMQNAVVTGGSHRVDVRVFDAEVTRYA